jgi:hypothetical protein
MPLAGEQVTGPWPEDDCGVRISQIEDIAQVASGVDFGQRKKMRGPFAVLHGYEIT